MHRWIMRTVYFCSLNNQVTGVLIWFFNLIMLLNKPNENKVRYLQSRQDFIQKLFFILKQTQNSKSIFTTKLPFN